MAKSKSDKLKLIKAVQTIEKITAKMNKATETIENFSESSSEKDTTDSALQDILNITGTYRIKNTGDRLTFKLIFLTEGVGAVTDGVLHDVNAPVDKPVVTQEKDSIEDKFIVIDTEANRKFLNIQSLIVATNLTTVPADLNAEFSISGGVSFKSFPIPPASFINVGDQIILEISIFFF